MELEPLDIEFPDVPCDGNFGVGMLGRTDRGYSYASYLKDKQLEWRVAARRYEAQPEDFHNAWWYLNLHPAFWKFYGPPVPKLGRFRWLRRSAAKEHAKRFHVRYLAEDRGVESRIEVWVAKVNPETGRMDDDDVLNTKAEIWLETGPWRWPSRSFDEYEVPFHDHRLDCGGDTYEEAIVEMARKVHDLYGNDRMVCDDHRETPRKLGADNVDASA
jgi:hypothetical protein